MYYLQLHCEFCDIMYQKYDIVINFCIPQICRTELGTKKNYQYV